MKLACELGSTTWTLGFTTAPARAPTGADDRRRGSRGAGEGAADRQGAVRAASDGAVQSCYEAGRDGVWLHRWLAAQGVEHVVVESSSIEVNRRARRAKTDRLDVGTWLARLLR